MNDWLAKKGFLDFKTRSLLHCMSLCCLCRCVLQWHSIREQRGTHKEKARKGEGKRRERLCRKKNGVLSYMDLQKDEECHLFLRSYFIFDVATKRIPLKGCFYVPDVLLPGNLHLQKHSCTTIPLGLLLAIMQQTIFSVRKVEKTWTNCVFIGPICAKSMLASRLRMERTIRRKGKQSFFSCSGFLPTSPFWRIHPLEAAK